MAGVLFAVPVVTVDLTTNLAAWYKINDGAGTNIVDSSVNANTATLTAGSGSWTGSAPAGGAYSTAFTFNASSIAVPATVSINPTTQSFTVSALVYGTSFGSRPAIIGSNTGTRLFLLAQNLGSYAGINCYVAGATTPAQTQDTTHTFATNTWTHVVGTWDGTNMNVYINGSLIAGPNQGSGIYSIAYNFVIGDGTPGFLNNWAGYIQNVRFYAGRALSASDIAYLSSIKG